MKTPTKSNLQLPGRIPGVIALTLAAGLMLPAATSLAQSYYTNNGTGDFNIAASWNPNGVPGAGINAANDNGSNNVVLIQPGDPAWTHGDTLAGNEAGTSGAWLQTGSTNFTGGGNWLRLGVATGSVGYYTLSNGLCQVGGETHVGELGIGNLLIAGGTYNTLGVTRVALTASGYMQITGGTVNNSGITSIGQSSNPGYYEIDGGTNNCTGSQIKIGNGDSANNATGTLTMNGGVINNSGELWIGEGTATQHGIGTMIMNGGVFNQNNNWFDIGRWGSTGTLTMTGGTINKTGTGNNTQWAAFNNNYPSSATINMSGGAINILGGVVQIAVGGNGTVGTTCLFNQSGGTFHAASEYQIATDNLMAVATNNVSGNAVLTCDSWLAVGRNGGIGTLNISGNAAVTKTGVVGNTHITIAGDNGATPSRGTVNQTGGTLTSTAADTWIGETGVANWTMSGGTAILGNVIMCVNGSASAQLFLNGGLFQATSIVSPTTGTTVSILSLNGVTLQANANNTTFISGLTSATVGANGVTLDSQGYNLTIPQELDDNGGGTLTKIGSGTVTFTGANTYAGATVVSAGTLITGSSSTASASTGVTVADNAGFGVAVQSSGGYRSISSLALGTSAGASLYFNLGAYGNPATFSSALLTLNNLTANGTITVNVSASIIAAGTIPLITSASPVVGSPTYVLGSLPAGVVAHLSSTSTSLSLVVTSAGAPRWDGNAGGTWDLGSDQNWYDLGTMMLTSYQDGHPVIFDDNAAGTTTVNLTATVAPASINFNNNSLPYSIIGTGKIGGASGVTLNGTANVSILNTGGNTFTGPVTVNVGVLNITNLANGGSPSPLGASSANPTNLVINGGTLQYSGSPVAVNRGFTVGDTNTTIDAEANLSLGNVAAIANVLEGGSALNKIGPAQLAVTGSGNNVFSTGSSPWVLVKNGTLLLDGSAGAQTNNTSWDMHVGCTPASGASLILSNSSLNVGAWLAVGRINGGINNTSTMALYNSAVTCANLSFGWDGGAAGNLASQFCSLNGSSTLTNNGNVNLCEGTGSTLTMSVNDNSTFWVKNPTYIASANYSTGTVVVANSAKLISASGWFDIGQGTPSVGSVLVKDNGSIATTGDMNVTDTGNGATASLTVQDNGKLSANNLWVGKADSVTATFTITNNATVVSSNGLTMATRFDGTPEVCTATLNLSGGSLAVNLVQGNIVSGVNYGVFNFNGGKLIIHPPYFGAQDVMYNLQAANVLAAGGTVEVDNADSVQFSQPLLGGNGDGGLTKLGTGSLSLNGVSTYTNTTTISQGTLGGTGTLASPVKVLSGGTLTAGYGAIGTLNINNALTFAAGSTSLMKVTPASNDSIQGLTSVAYAGALVVTNDSASPLVVGHTYTLFNSAAAGTGNFSSVTLLPSGTATFNPANGVLTITSLGAGLTFNAPYVSGGNLVLTGMGGTPGAGYTLLTSTNLTPPVAWTTNTTGNLDGTGAFSNNIPVSVSTPARFFRIQTP